MSGSSKVPVTPTTLPEWLDFIAQQHGQVIDMGLERVRQVYQRLGIDRSSLGRVITVAGTNGKGTTVAALEALLRAQGMTVAVYTSPHLLRYNERVRLNARDADDDALCRSFAAVDAARQGQGLTYFEFGTLAALHAFAQLQPDFSILEVGLGGRLDAVNIIDPDLAIITTIDIDHVDWLGPDRESIGFEKAGILRPKIPFVCGDPQPPQSVQAQSLAQGCRSFWQDREFGMRPQQIHHWNWYGVDAAGVAIELTALPEPAIPLPNLAVALQALAVLDLLPDAELVRNLVPAIQVAGRMQRLGESPEVYLDVGHNPQAARYLAQRIRALGGRWLAVYSSLADKDIGAVVAALADVIDQWYCAPLVADRAATKDQLQAAFTLNGLHNIRWYASLDKAYDDARKAVTADDRILVFGSFYTVAAIMQSESAGC